MPFFLEQLGLKLAQFPNSDHLPPVPEVDDQKPISIPNISPLGFVVSQDHGGVIDFKDSNLRASVFGSFSNIGLYIQDTKLISPVRLQVSNTDALLIVKPSINDLCSKMHIEDISPIQDSTCNHSDVDCKGNHVENDSLLIKVGDLEVAAKDDAIFRVHKSSLHFRKGKKWIDLNIKSKLPDNFYTLIEENF